MSLNAGQRTFTVKDFQPARFNAWNYLAPFIQHSDHSSLAKELQMTKMLQGIGCVSHLLRRSFLFIENDNLVKSGSGGASLRQISFETLTDPARLIHLLDGHPCGTSGGSSGADGLQDLQFYKQKLLRSRSSSFCSQHLDVIFP